MDTSDIFETAEQVAARLHVRPCTIFEWSRRRTNPLPSRRITRKHVLFLWPEVKAWIDQGGTLRPKLARKVAA